MCTAHNFARLSLLRSVALQRLSSGDRVGEVRKTYLDYGEACAIYLERDRPRGTENVPQKICVQHIILPVLVY